MPRHPVISLGELKGGAKLPQGQRWSADEVRHALVLYLKTAFGRLHRGNPDVINLAMFLGRTPSAVALKLVNLAALDTSIPQRGMGNTSKVDRQVWAEFMSAPEQIIDTFARQSAQLPPFGGPQPVPGQPQELDEDGISFDFQGSEKRIETTRRIGQGLFRQMILVSYQNRCALTGIEDKRLLNASHIVPWKDDSQNRVNPSNGICLNVLHDRAFDRHLITFDEDFKMKIAAHVPIVARRQLEKVDSGELELPTRFLPDQEFLEQHRRAFYQKHV